jgi:hypothetical protein
MLAFVMIVMRWRGYTVPADKNSRVPFAPDELARFNRERRLACIDGSIAGGHFSEGSFGAVQVGAMLGTPAPFQVNS